MKSKIVLKIAFLSVINLLFIVNLVAQNTISGSVTDETGEPLIGVNILIKNTATGTITDINGKYQLQVNPTETLLFSYTGYADVAVSVNSRTIIDLIMVESAALLEEVVVVGYGVQKKSDVTGAVTRLQAEDINKIPTASVDQALQGKVAGVQVTPISGEPGKGAIIRIRGIGTLNNASPIYVVDGVILDDISFLSMNDVENIDVLKDASATAIYGSRGANGVIIITTKKGKIGENTVFNFSAYYGIQQVVRKIGLVNAQEFATLANETAANEGQSPLFTDPSSFGEGTDWQDVIFQDAPIQSYQLSAAGGTEKMTYNISGNFIQQEGIIRQSKFQRATLRINNDYQLAKPVKIGHNLSLVYTESVGEPGVLGGAYRVYPTFDARDADGNFIDTSPLGNPEAQFEFNNNKQIGFRAIGNIYGEINLFQHFTFRSSFGLDVAFNRGRGFTPVFFVSPNQQNEENQLNINTNRNHNIVWDNTLTYNQTWDDHHLTVLGGIAIQEFFFESLGGSRRNFPGETEEFFYLNAGAADFQSNSNIAGEWGIFSYLFRTNYSYKDRYLLTANYRLDGSSRFGRNNRWGHFPSVSVGWIASNEPFFDGASFFSRLKLRAGYGVIGNDKAGSFYPSQATITSNLNAVFGVEETLNQGAAQIELANPDLKWEATAQLNIGVEMGFLQNQLTAEIDYYNKRTSDILINVPIPDYVGARAAPIINAAEVENQGVDIALNWRKQSAFSYNFGLVASFIKNEVIGLGGGKEELLDGGLGVGGKLITRTIPGLPIGSFYGFQTNGIFQNEEALQGAALLGDEVPGDFRFADINGDGVITRDGDRVFLGSPIPDFIFGINLGANYKGFDFTLAFNGQTGNKIVNAKKAARFGTYNYEDSYLNRWTGEGTSNSEPRVTNGGHNYNESDWLIENGDFIRLRTIQLGYTLPKTVLTKINFDQIRFYVSGTNLITWTAYSGYTPEITSSSVLNNGIDRGIYPIAKTYTFGVNAIF